MPTEILAVDGVGANDAWTLTAGASKAAAVALPDDEDTTCITGTVGQIQSLLFADSAIGAGDTINSVTIILRSKGSSDLGTPASCKQQEGANLGTAFNLPKGVGYADITETARTLAPDGGAWNLTKLNNLAARLDGGDDLASVVTTLFATVDYTLGAAGNNRAMKVLMNIG